MKYLNKNVGQQSMIACLLLGLAGFSGFFMPTPAICDNSVADEIISLKVTDQPLGEVLETISIDVDCQFSIDESWQNFPVTASFDNEPLYRGLKLILQDINSAVIYGADRTIKIVIYDESTLSGKVGGPSIDNKSPRELNQQLQLSGEATAPQPEVADSEDINDAENAEQQTEETADSDSDSNEANDENTVAEETAPAEDDEESESAGDRAENVETTESGEETSEN